MKLNSLFGTPEPELGRVEKIHLILILGIIFKRSFLLEYQL